MSIADREDDPLDDFDARSIELDGIARRVYVSGHGPGVVVMAEMPGISPDVARFARWVRQAGFTVYMRSPHASCFAAREPSIARQQGAAAPSCVMISF